MDLISRMDIERAKRFFWNYSLLSITFHKSRSSICPDDAARVALLQELSWWNSKRQH